MLAMKSEATGVINVASDVNSFDVNGIIIPESIETLVTNLHDSLTS